MAPNRTLLIVNPRSQNSALGKRWPRLSNIVRRSLGSFEVAFTSGPNDATHLTRSALKEGVELVVAIGGDGTINEVANGFYESGALVAPNAAMGILPFGTGGDFRKTLGIPKDIEKASEILVRFKTEKIDMGHLQYTSRENESQQERYFVNIASFGISGEVDEAVNKSSKRLGGRVTFLLTSAKVALKYKGKRVRLTFDGAEDKAIETTISTVAVANGRFFGGGMKIAPDASLYDGAFDVVSIEDMSLSQSLSISRYLYKGSHLHLDHVSQRKAKVVLAEPLTKEEVLLDVDGEAPGKLPATFRILPQSLRIVVP